MAKANFHKHQRVFVNPVGTWAQVEQVLPQWADGVEEPIRIYYDVGLGRKFVADQLLAEDVALAETEDAEAAWRIVRAPNKWRSAEECQHHPYPGTHPVIATGEHDWSGWRVPGVEYERDPHGTETRAQLIAKTPRFVALLNELINLASEMPYDLPAAVMDIAVQARNLMHNPEHGQRIEAADAEQFALQAEEDNAAAEPPQPTAPIVDARQPVEQPRRSVNATTLQIDDDRPLKPGAAAPQPLPSTDLGLRQQLKLRPTVVFGKS
jgi:hypothetical protein